MIFPWGSVVLILAACDRVAVANQKILALVREGCGPSRPSDSDTNPSACAPFQDMLSPVADTWVGRLGSKAPTQEEGARKVLRLRERMWLATAWDALWCHLEVAQIDYTACSPVLATPSRYRHSPGHLNLAVSFMRLMGFAGRTTGWSSSDKHRKAETESPQDFGATERYVPAGLDRTEDLLALEGAHFGTLLIIDNWIVRELRRCLNHSCKGDPRR